MSWRATPTPGYPAGQQYYQINITAVPWGELWRTGGISLVLAAPIVAFCKLFRIRLAMGDKFPREVSFQQPDQLSFQQRYQRVSHLVEGFQALGFEHFTTFRIPEMPYDTMVFALMNRAENAYGVAYDMITPAKTKTMCDITTGFRDGTDLTSCTSKEAVAVPSPPGRHKQAFPGALPEQLWQAHQAKVAELAPAAGGVAGPVSPEDFIEHWRQYFRECADFQAGRGVYVPVV
jgi:hypothetical protein